MSLTKKITNDFMKSKMTDTIADRGYCPNLNSISIPGTYRVDSATLNKPKNLNGMVFHSQANGTICFTQRFVGYSATEGAEIFERVCWLNEWWPWVKLLTNQIN